MYHDFEVQIIYQVNIFVWIVWPLEGNWSDHLTKKTLMWWNAWKSESTGIILKYSRTACSIPPQSVCWTVSRTMQRNKSTDNFMETTFLVGYSIGTNKHSTICVSHIILRYNCCEAPFTDIWGLMLECRHTDLMGMLDSIRNFVDLYISVRRQWV